MKQTAIIAVLSLVILFGSQSCSKRYCNQKYPPETVTTETIKEVEKIVIRDTTIFVKLPSDTLTFSDTIFVDKKCQVKVVPVVRENDRVKATAYIKGNRLFIEVVNKPMAIEVILKKALVDRDYWKEKAESETKTVTVNVKTRFDRFARSFFWVFASTTLIFIALYLRRLLK